MKTNFVEPDIEVVRFAVENILTSSGFRAVGMNPGFDEVEPDMHDYMEDEIIMYLMPPCG